MTTTPKPVKRQSDFKFRLEHKGIVVAESDWSNILFDYLRRDTVKSENYAIFNNVTGLPAGTPTAKTTVKPAATRKRSAPRSAAATTRK